MGFHQKTSGWTRQEQGELASGLGNQVGRGRCWSSSGGTSECGVPVGWVCECCMFVVSTELEQPSTWGPRGGSEGWGPGRGRGQQRGHASAWGTRVCARVPARVIVGLCQAQRRREHGCGCRCVMGVLCMGAAGGSVLAVAGCVIVRLCVLCMCLCAHLCVSGIRAQLRCWSNQLCQTTLGRDPGSPGGAWDGFAGGSASS